MDKVDITAYQFIVICNPLDSKPPKMDEEFQVECGDIGAGIALTGVVQHQAFKWFSKVDVDVFDLLYERLALEKGLT